MSTLERALEIAREAHAGQVDKAKRPYIEHVMRVVNAVEGEDAKIVAALHDVLEDGPEHLRDQVLLGTPYHLLPDVLLLRHCAGEAYQSYIASLGQRKIARMVKIADLLDNSDPARLALLPEADRARLSRKYAAALATLGAA